MKIFAYIISIINILILLLFWIVIQLDVKFSFGAEQSTYVFNKGQELGEKTSLFITLLIVLNLIMIGITFFQSKKTNTLKN
jgi:heme/copper-type cytochrome/quinol oxidase subunit 2